MKNLPAVIKIILNIIFYLVYTFIALLIIWFILPFVFHIFIENGSTKANNITIIVSIFVFFITIIFRKYFYISLLNEQKEVEYNKKLFKTIQTQEKKDSKKEEIIIKDYLDNWDNIDIKIWKN